MKMMINKIDVMKKYISLVLFLSLAACGGFENEKIDTNQEIETNRLIVPPCLK